MQIAAGGDAVFRRLVEAMDMQELADDPRYARSKERITRPDELEKILSDWIAARDFHDIEQRLVGNNVPFGGIYTASDIAEDPHYAARSNIVDISDPEEGTVRMPAPLPKLKRTPGRVSHAGPPLGQHNTEIYGGLLDLSEQDLAAFRSFVKSMF